MLCVVSHSWVRKSVRFLISWTVEKVETRKMQCSAKSKSVLLHVQAARRALWIYMDSRQTTMSGRNCLSEIQLNGLLAMGQASAKFFRTCDQMICCLIVQAIDAPCSIKLNPLTIQPCITTMAALVQEKTCPKMSPIWLDLHSSQNQPKRLKIGALWATSDPVSPAQLTQDRALTKQESSWVTLKISACKTTRSRQRRVEPRGSRIMREACQQSSHPPKTGAFLLISESDIN